MTGVETGFERGNLTGIWLELVFRGDLTGLDGKLTGLWGDVTGFYRGFDHILEGEFGRFLGGFDRDLTGGGDLTDSRPWGFEACFKRTGGSWSKDFGCAT